MTNCTEKKAWQKRDGAAHSGTASSWQHREAGRIGIGVADELKAAQ